MQRITTTILIITSVLAFASSASALTQITSSSGTSGDVVYVGDLVTFGIRQPWVCYDSPGSTNDKWIRIGDTNGLDDDYIINGDQGSSSSGGADVMTVIRADNTSVGSGFCAGTWYALTYNGKFLDLEGNGGADTLRSGSGDSWVRGEDGNDRVVNYSAVGSARGGNGSDTVEGRNGNADVLLGEADQDCLYDLNNSWSTYDCGSETDDYYYLNSGTMTSCENAVLS